MPTKKETVLVEELPQDDLTVKVREKDEGYKGQYVPVLLPELPDAGDGLKVDKYEHVTLANEDKETCYKVIRGEWTEVPWPVFVAMKQGRYPKL